MKEDHIDDMFRKGLLSNEYEVPKEDWENARVLLGLDKRKRRVIPFWWWGVSIAAVILIGALTLPGVLQQESDLIVQDSVLVQNTRGQETDINSEGVIETATYSDEDLESSQAPISQDSNKGQFQLESPQIVVNESRDDSKLKSVSSDQFISNNSTQEIDNTSERVVDNIDKIKLDNDLNTGVDDNPNQMMIGRAQVVFNPTQSAPSNRPKLILAAKAASLPIFGVETPDFEVLPNSSRSIIATDCEDCKPAFMAGLYGRASVPKMIPAMGMFEEMMFSKGYFISAGLGVNYESNAAITREGILYTTDANGLSVTLEAAEIINSDLFNIEMPVLIGKRISSHRLFTGVLFDLPIYSVSEVDSDFTLTNDLELDNQDMPNPNRAPTVSQSQVFTNTEDLRVINSQLLIGYGFDLSSRFTIEAMGAYTLNKRPVVTTGLSASAQFVERDEIIKDDRWLFSLGAKLWFAR